jgi:hypothetical protein
MTAFSSLDLCTWVIPNFRKQLPASRKVTATFTYKAYWLLKQNYHIFKYKYDELKHFKTNWH